MCTRSAQHTDWTLITTLCLCVASHRPDQRTHREVDEEDSDETKKKKPAENQKGDKKTLQIQGNPVCHDQMLPDAELNANGLLRPNSSSL